MFNQNEEQISLLKCYVQSIFTSVVEICVLNDLPIVYQEICTMLYFYVWFTNVNCKIPVMSHLLQMCLRNVMNKLCLSYKELNGVFDFTDCTFHLVLYSYIL